MTTKELEDVIYAPYDINHSNDHEHYMSTKNVKLAKSFSRLIDGTRIINTKYFNIYNLNINVISTHQPNQCFEFICWKSFLRIFFDAEKHIIVIPKKLTGLIDIDEFITNILKQTSLEIISKN